MKGSQISEALMFLEKWCAGETELTEVDWLLGFPQGKVATLFLGNGLADVLGKPIEANSYQDCVNVLVFYLALMPLKTRKEVTSSS